MSTLFCLGFVAVLIIGNIIKVAWGILEFLFSPVMLVVYGIIIVVVVGGVVLFWAFCHVADWVSSLKKKKSKTV